LNAGGQTYQGDYSNGSTKPLYEVFVTNPVSNSFDMGLRLGTGTLADKKYFTATTTYVGLNGKFYMLPSTKFSPYISGSLDAMHIKSEDRFGEQITLESDWAANLSIGLGIEYRFWDKMGLNAVFDYNYLMTDDIDGVNKGTINDYFWAFRFGFSFYPGL